MTGRMPAFARVLLAVTRSKEFIRASPSDSPLLSLPGDPSAILVYGFVIPRFAFGFGVWLLRRPKPDDARDAGLLRARALNAAGVVPAFRFAIRWCGVVVAVLLDRDVGRG
jgi:hypothetical protein